MKNFIIKFLFTLIAIIQLQCLAQAREVVVLVPGFFNSFAPKYFSEEVISSFTEKGFQVYTAEGLNPIGTIEDNGQRLESILGQVEKLEGQKVNFNLIAHSAGGFYSLWVANRHRFEVKNIFTVSTPFKGVEFIQEWIDRSFLFNALTDLACLDGLVELTATGVEKFLSTIKVNPQTKIYAFGGYQDEGFDITDARNISVPLRITSHYISENSDGIVGFSSSMGLGQIKTTDNKSALQFRDQNYFLALEHWEQVLDYRSFLILGIRNTSYIKNEQHRFYSGLADLLVKVK